MQQRRFYKNTPSRDSGRGSGSGRPRRFSSDRSSSPRRDSEGSYAGRGEGTTDRSSNFRSERSSERRPSSFRKDFLSTGESTDRRPSTFRRESSESRGYEGRSSSFSRPRTEGGFNRNSEGKSEFRRQSGGFRRPSGFGSGRGSGSGRFGGRGRSRNGFVTKKIGHEKYVSKADPAVVTVSYIAKQDYADFHLESTLQDNLVKKKYVTPTQIQDLAIPFALEGRDVLGLATTGSGKTAAFLIPLVNKSLKNTNEKALIIVPTRELAVQIQEEFWQLSRNTFLKSALVIGGASMSRQSFDLKRQPQFVIGTPGRLKDLLERNILRLTDFNNIVLDEVDRMLDMGFVDDIKMLISKLKNERQSLFFSATMSREVEVIANSLLRNPEKIEVESSKTSKNVEQDIIRVSGGSTKIETLHDLLIHEDFKKVLIFTKTKMGADRLSRELLSRGFKVDSIHGDKTQGRRDRVIQKFKRDEINMLVATDVAARGLDIPDISHVINYDEPATYEDYIHRIGRTGRSGKKGKALTFVG